MTAERSVAGWRPSYDWLIAPALGLAVFVVNAYCVTFASDGGPVPGVFFTNSLPLAALLRMPGRRWPALIFASVVGSMAAGMMFGGDGDDILVAAVRAASNVQQYYFCALIVRRRFRRYFDLLEPAQLFWLFGAGAVTTVIKLAMTIGLNAATGIAAAPLVELLKWAIVVYLGLFVLSLPILAMTARGAREGASLGGIGFGLIVPQLAILWVVFGPPAVLGVYLTIPVVLVLAWRNGLFGAGIGTLGTFIVACALERLSGGLRAKLFAAGYSATERGVYFELLFSTIILISLPIAVARARQRRTDRQLEGALAATRRRADLLEQSEAAARQSEMAMLHNEERWRAALEGSGFGVWDWDRTTGSIYYSGVWKTMRGFDDDDAEIGNGYAEWEDRLHPDDRERAVTAVQRYLRGEVASYEQEYRTLCKDGRYRWILDHGMIFERDEAGSPTRIVGTNVDIDSVKQSAMRAERRGALSVAVAACNAAMSRGSSIEHLSRRICRLLVESGAIKLAWVGFAKTDRTRIVPIAMHTSIPGVERVEMLDISKASAHAAGMAATALRRNHAVWVSDFSHDPLATTWREVAAQRGLRGAAALPLRRRGKAVGVLILYAGEVDYFDEDTRTILSDMMAQFSLALDALDAEETARQFREGLLASEQRFRTMFEASPLGIAVMDTEKGHFLDINDMFCTIVGRKRDALIDKRWHEITHPDDIERELALSAPFIAGDSTGFSFEKRYVRPGQEAVWVHMTVAPFPLPGEDGRRHLCMIEDITERMQLERQVQLAQRMEAIGQLTGGLAHDFNNLLTVVVGSGETLAERLQDPEDRQLADLILEAAEQGTALTRHMLAFSRRQPLAPQSFDINELLDKHAPLIQRTVGAGLRFIVSKSAGLAPVYADPTQTGAAILNLCINARDAMPEGGTLSISTAGTALTEEFVRQHVGAEAGDYISIQVSDTGVGIDPALLDHIFEPFFTTKEIGMGSGLGLSMVYGFVQQSKGTIDVNSEQGRGTSFTIYLPVAATLPNSLNSVRQLPDELLRGDENVLIVEDNDLVREHVHGQFDSLGYKVTTVPDGVEALKMLEARDDFDLLFTDIIMPGGLNGRELGELAQSRWPWLRVLYTSGYAQDVLLEEGRLVEGVTLLSKPYSKRTLAEKVRSVLDRVN